MRRSQHDGTVEPDRRDDAPYDQTAVAARTAMTTDAAMDTEPGWQVDTDAAGAYERYLVPSIFAGLARRLVDVVGVDAGDHVLDAACGTGVVARTAARRVGPLGDVAGVDINPDMLAVARRAAADADPAITWHRGDLTALPFDDDTFDIAICEEALQFLDDPVAGLVELGRVTAPGGVVAFSVLRGLAHHDVYARLVSALRTHVSSAAAMIMASPFEFGGGGRCRHVAESAGLGDVVVRIVVGEERFPSISEFVRQEAASSPLAGELATLDGAGRDALVAALEDSLTAHVDDHGLVFPNQTRIVTGRVPGAATPRT